MAHDSGHPSSEQPQLEAVSRIRQASAGADYLCQRECLCYDVIKIV
jgi:hypothetical protein